MTAETKGLTEVVGALSRRDTDTAAEILHGLSLPDVIRAAGPAFAECVASGETWQAELVLRLGFAAWARLPQEATA